MPNRIITIATFLCFMLSASIAVEGADLKKFLVRGYIYDESYNPIDSVEVSLTCNDTIAVPFNLLTGNSETRINKSGSLRMMVDGGLGDYTLVLEKEGYEPLVRRFTIASVSEDLKYLSSLIMEKERYISLGEVSVQATRVKMVMKGDTIVFDAAAFKLQEGSMLDALVRQLPGATLSTDGVIEINGRKINELLVNGKDFFQGDPKVALQNLPAYTVKNLKVYDKADKDAYLTHSDARLDKQEQDENLVMDVVLKKEYDAGYMANVEGGYGTRDRYMGRGFGLGYTSKFRLAAFVNANNIGDSSQGGTSGQWRGATSEENGMTNRITSGLDYNYTVPEKTEASGSLTYTGVRASDRDITARTSFFDTGDIFGRSYSTSRRKDHSLRTAHRFNRSFPNVSIYFNPVFSWQHSERNSDSRSASFTSNPSEEYRGQALDSLFRTGNVISNFSRNMLTKLHQMSANNGDAITGSYSLGATIRPKTWKGMLMVSSTGNLTHSTNDTRTLYDQAYGPAGSQGGKPVRNDRFTPNETNSRSIGGALRYQRDIRRFGDERTNNFTYQLSASYLHNHDDNNDPLYSSDSLPDILTPPSAILVPGLLFDPSNSPYTFEQRNGVGTGLVLNFSNAPTNPGDSTMNSSFNAHFSLNYDYRHFDYHYIKPGITDQRIERNTNFVRPQVNLGYNSSNKIRNIYINLSYGFEPSAPAMSALIDTRNSSNPLEIITGNPDGLKNSISHNVSINLIRFGRDASNSRFMIWGYWRVMTDAVAWARRYDPSTGVTIQRPENISGNWNTNLTLDWSSSYGTSRNLTLHIRGDVAVNNSADYMAVNANPVRSSVLSQSYRPQVSLDYTFRQGSTLTAGFSTKIGHQHSERENFNNMTWYEYWPYVRAFVKLPADMNLNTQFNPYFRRGYTNSSMNTNEYVWDATLTKSFAKPTITLKLSAHDILGSAKHVYTSVSAQGRSETWRYTLPRYVMLSVGYRLDMKPRSGKSHNSSRNNYFNAIRL
ncbi:MAG: hypothetical protein HDR92_07955 [Bacteroides sp.]|nr:hypothetical protein [Bacteroides sp.]